MKDWTTIWKRIALVGQLGFSLTMPLLLCLLAGNWLTVRCGAGLWVYVPLFVLGLGGSFATALRLYRSFTKERGGAERTAFNHHD